MKRNTLTITIYTNHSEIRATFPARWVICEACDGHATTTRHVECDGGGFTASEWEEACRDDEDFAEKYVGGFYDRPCPECQGLGRVQVVDRERCLGWRQRFLLKALDAQVADDVEYNAICAAERRMGA